jgi:uncharacterized protein (DUF2267 family)
VTREHERFITTVQQKAAIARPDAERAARATLETLAERLSAGEARDLAAQMPPELAPALATNSEAQPFDVDDFIRRVATRGDVDVDAAERHARAVFDALRRMVSADEIEDMAAELPKDFAALIGEAEGRSVPVLPAETLLRRVADRAALDVDGARRAAEAVLMTLGERIAGGEVDDLIGRLPAELQPPLRRGKAASKGVARRMSLDDFLRRVAEREGVTPTEAREHTRAVFATLREAVGEDEFRDVSVQLPLEYASVQARP